MQLFHMIPTDEVQSKKQVAGSKLFCAQLLLDNVTIL